MTPQDLRDMDKQIADKIMGIPFRKPTHGTCCTCQICGHPNDAACQCGYSDDIQMAYAIIEKLNLPVTMSSGYDTLNFWEVRFGLDSHEHIANAETLPHAICLAALKTVTP